MYRHPQHMMHQGTSGLADPVAMRQKDEQRRRQQAYAQALAQQVQQREQQKQREREIERQGTSHGRTGQSLGAFPAGGSRLEQQHEPAKGLWDGLGERANVGRTNFARGQRQAPPQQQQQYAHAPNGYQSDPIESIQQHNQYEQSPSLQSVGRHSSGFVLPGGHGTNVHVFAQPQSLYPMMGISPASHAMDAATFSDWGAPLQQQQQPAVLDERFGDTRGHHQHSDHVAVRNDHEPQPLQHQYHNQNQNQNYQQQQQQQDEPSAHHRGRRSEFTDAGGFRSGAGAIGSDDDNKARHKLQQQQAMQLALQQQVEEKARQKLEAKRRQDDDDRREAAQFEAEQQRVRQEADAAKALKQRKAADELARAQQAADALASHQKRAQQNRQQQQQQRHDFDDVDEVALRQPRLSPQRPLQHQATAPPMRPQMAPQPPHKMDPFANTRAHLFEDPPSPPRQQTQQQRQSRQWAMPPSPTASSIHLGDASAFHRQQQQMQVTHDHRNVPTVDPAVLQRQYDEMREELERQRQLVEQLRHAHAQAQIQMQQQQSLANNASSPTLSDLEQLRSELRAELAHREQLHRHELETFCAQQQQLQRMRSSLQLVRASGSRDDRASSQDQRVVDPLSVNPYRYDHQSREQVLSRSHTRPMQASVSHELELERELGSTSTSTKVASLSSSIVTPPLASLPCDSTLVYFDGRVHALHHEPQPQQPANSHSVVNDDDSASRLSVVKAKRSVPMECVSERSVEFESIEAVAAVTPLRVRERSIPRALEKSDNQLRESSVAIHATKTQTTQQPQHQQRGRFIVTELIGVGSVGNDDDDDDDDAHAFFVKDLRSSIALECEVSGSANVDRSQRSASADRRSGASARYASWTEPHCELDGSESWDPAARRASTRKWLHLVEHDNDDDDDDDDDDGVGDNDGLLASVSLEAEELEAIFQRNVRRHDILRAFQAAPRSNQHEPSGAKRAMAWSELHEQLEANSSDPNSVAPEQRGASTIAGKAAVRRQPREESLVASSRWMQTAM